MVTTLAERWADTGTGRLMIAVLGGLADVERDLIRTRTAEDRSLAKAGGVKLGRKIKRRDRYGELLCEIARSYNASKSTISWL